MSERATHYIALKDPNCGPLPRFWLDPYCFERGEFMGNGGWDEQCSYCGQSLNEFYRLTQSRAVAECQNCQERYEVRAAD